MDLKIYRCPSCKQAVVIDASQFQSNLRLVCASCHYSDYGYAFSHQLIPHGTDIKENIMQLLDYLDNIVGSGEIQNFIEKKIHPLIMNLSDKYKLHEHTVFELLNAALFRHSTKATKVDEELITQLQHKYCVIIEGNDSVSAAMLMDYLKDAVSRLHHQDSSSFDYRHRTIVLECDSLRRKLDEKTTELQCLITQHRDLIMKLQKTKEKLKEYDPNL